MAGLLIVSAVPSSAQELEIYRPSGDGASRSELPQRVNFPQPEPEPAPEVNTNVLPEPDVNLLDPEPKSDTQPDKQESKKPEPADPPVTQTAIQPGAPATPEAAVTPGSAPNSGEATVPVPGAKPNLPRRRKKRPVVESEPVGEIPVVGVELGGGDAAVAGETPRQWDNKDLDRK